MAAELEAANACKNLMQNTAFRLLTLNFDDFNQPGGSLPTTPIRW
jgi:hypothetical protein